MLHRAIEQGGSIVFRLGEDGEFAVVSVSDDASGAVGVDGGTPPLVAVDPSIEEEEEGEGHG